MVKIVKLHDNAKIPTYGTPGSNGFDFYAIEHGFVMPQSFTSFGTGLAFGLPEGHALFLFSRSGHGFKHGIRLCNSVAIIDHDYTGEVAVGLFNDSDEIFQVKIGDRIAQGIIMPAPQVKFELVDSLEKTARGDKGFGSTGG